MMSNRLPTNVDQKKKELHDMFAAIERLDDADRKFVAGAIAFASAATRKTVETTTSPPTNQAS